MKEINQIREIIKICSDGRGLDFEDFIEIEQLLKNIEDKILRKDYKIKKL